MKNTKVRSDLTLIQQAHHVPVEQMQVLAVDQVIIVDFQEKEVVLAGEETVVILMVPLILTLPEIHLHRQYQIVKDQALQKECQKEKQKRLVRQKQLH